MKKPLLILTALLLSLTLLAQKPKDSTVVQIQIDTASLKVVQNLIIENMKGEPTTKNILINNIFGILLKDAKIVPLKTEATKPKEVKTK